MVRSREFSLSIKRKGVEGDRLVFNFGERVRYLNFEKDFLLRKDLEAGITRICDTKVFVVELSLPNLPRSGSASGFSSLFY